MDARATLKQFWGFDEFRPLQEDIITSVMAGYDTLALMPTGGGKSICYQVPGLAQEGLCLVVSPLIALMKDQVYNLRQRNIPSVAIYSGLSRREIDIMLDNCAYGKYKFLYLSPERLATDIVRQRLEKMNINLVAVDEAHCISQWGYDFRPSYLRIADIRELIPQVPFLALTATAPPRVQEDIREKLLFGEDCQTFQKSFKRENLSYVVRYEENKNGKLLDILQKIKGTGIVYVRNRRKTKDIAEFLQHQGVSASYYHAGLPAALRTKRQEKWVSGEIRVMVCTNAFGMGIDKPDVRTVIHMDLPDSLEAYYQEAGRAGRDGKRSYAVLLYHDEDRQTIQERLEHHFPSVDEVKRVYQALANFFQLAVGAGQDRTFPFDMGAFYKTYNLHPIKVHNALKLLEQQELLVSTESVFIPSRIMAVVSNLELYRFQVQNPKLEPLIKLLLRSSGGIFDGYVRVKEKQLAQYLGWSEETVEKGLNYLKQCGLVDYQKRSESPRITFLTPRQDTRYISLDKAFINQRKQNYEEQLKSVLHYAQNQTICRSRVLVNYFGEETEENCGICDVCIERNKTDLGQEEYRQIMEAVQHMLREEPLPIDQVMKHFNQHKEENVLQTLRWLMDNERVVQGKDERLEWRE
jgi:ATP-dependent DNA helicase RecQ